MEFILHKTERPIMLFSSKRLFLFAVCALTLSSTTHASYKEIRPTNSLSKPTLASPKDPITITKSVKNDSYHISNSFISTSGSEMISDKYEKDSAKEAALEPFELPYSSFKEYETTQKDRYIKIKYKYDDTIIIHLAKSAPTDFRKKHNDTLKDFANFQYHSRILRWFTSPDLAMKEDGYSQPSHINSNSKLSRYYIEEAHTFFPILDRYVFRYGQVFYHPEGITDNANVVLYIKVMRCGHKNPEFRKLVYNFYKNYGDYEYTCNHRCLHKLSPDEETIAKTYFPADA